MVEPVPVAQSQGCAEPGESRMIDGLTHGLLPSWFDPRPVLKAATDLFKCPKVRETFTEPLKFAHSANRALNFSDFCSPCAVVRGIAHSKRLANDASMVMRRSRCTLVSGAEFQQKYFAITFPFNTAADAAHLLLINIRVTRRRPLLFKNVL